MKRALILALVGAFTLTPAHANLNRLVLEGQLASATGTRSATLHILCNPDPDGGAISIELWVPQAFKLKDFAYGDFEGPDAAAGDHELSRVSVVGGTDKTEITHAAAGWYSGEDPDTFVFGLSQLSHQQSQIATLLKAINATRTQLVWVQKGFDDPKREIRATFTLDAATVKRIHETVDVCLAPAARSKRAVKK